MTDRSVGAEPQKAFWEKMAERYPRPFDEEQLAHTRGIIAAAEGMGVTLDGATLLDVGCGTGVYALPLAARAARVVGLDISEEMTRRFEAECVEHGITNATAICSPWGDAAIGEHGLEHAFDVVWVAMLPTIRSRADISRLIRCSRRSCVYVGWNASRTNPFLEAIFTAHGQPFGPPRVPERCGRRWRSSGCEAKFIPVSGRGSGTSPLRRLPRMRISSCWRTQSPIPATPSSRTSSRAS